MERISTSVFWGKAILFALYGESFQGRGFCIGPHHAALSFINFLHKHALLCLLLTDTYMIGSPSCIVSVVRKCRLRSAEKHLGYPWSMRRERDVVWASRCGKRPRVWPVSEAILFICLCIGLLLSGHVAIKRAAWYNNGTLWTTPSASIIWRNIYSLFREQD